MLNYAAGAFKQNGLKKWSKKSVTAYHWAAGAEKIRVLHAYLICHPQTSTETPHGQRLYGCFSSDVINLN